MPFWFVFKVLLTKILIPSCESLPFGMKIPRARTDLIEEKALVVIFTINKSILYPPRAAVRSVGKEGNLSPNSPPCTVFLSSKSECGGDAAILKGPANALVSKKVVCFRLLQNRIISC